MDHFQVMATPKQTKTAPEAGAVATAAPSAPRSRVNENDKFVRNYGQDGKPLPVTVKIPPQAKVILDGIEQGGKKGVTRGELEKSITGVLVTRQPVGRIVSYYQKLLTADTGLAKIEMAAPTPVAAPAAKAA